MITAVLTEPNERLAHALRTSGLVERAVLLVQQGKATGASTLGGLPLRELEATDPGSGAVVEDLLERAGTGFLLQVIGDFDPHPSAIRRLWRAVSESGASMGYGDYVDHNPAQPTAPIAHPLATWQEGSLEDAFAFGPLRLWSVDVGRRALAQHGTVRGRAFHGWYDLRLKGSRLGPIVHLAEPLGTLIPADQRASGQRVFDYLTVGRDRQIEAEHVCTEHLRGLGALVTGPFQPYVPTGEWPVEASVVIPVRNRIKTVADAVRSALSQQTSFPFNVIVVDNHSTDGTTEALRAIAASDPRLIHVTPERTDLGIGGCWNVAIQHVSAGKYVCQLDSDDTYSGTDTLQRMVHVLAGQRCGLAVGSYTLVNMKLEVIPPGLIDHLEWTDDNGPNNALRIGGLGAPRAYATQLLRDSPFPNASYGEDYAAVLRVSRTYKVGRIYDSLYWCRRWEDNSDADLNHATKAKYQTYKDRIRTLELHARIRGNRS